MPESLDEVIQLASKMEMDGLKFYTEAAENAANPQGRRLFESLAADEKRHLEIIESIARGRGVDILSMPMPGENIKTVFSDADVEIGEEDRATADEKRAVELAMGMEKRSYELYHGRCEVAKDEAEKALFERLAQEENQHYEILVNTLEYLEDNNKWVLWDEWGLLTGDMSSLG